jgi:hypothetical protein
LGVQHKARWQGKRAQQTIARDVAAYHIIVLIELTVDLDLYRGRRPTVWEHLRPLPIADLSHQTFARPVLSVRLGRDNDVTHLSQMSRWRKHPFMTVLVCLGNALRAQESSSASKSTCLVDNELHRHLAEVYPSPRQICVSSFPHAPQTKT